MEIQYYQNLKMEKYKRKKKKQIKHVFQKKSRNKDINELGNRKIVLQNKFNSQFFGEKFNKLLTESNDNGSNNGNTK